MDYLSLMRVKGASDELLAAVADYLKRSGERLLRIKPSEFTLSEECLADLSVVDSRQKECSFWHAPFSHLFPSDHNLVCFRLDLESYPKDFQFPATVQVDLGKKPTIGDYVVFSFGEGSIRLAVAFGVYLGPGVIGAFEFHNEERVLVPYHIELCGYSSVDPVRWARSERGEYKGAMVSMMLDYGENTIDLYAKSYLDELNASDRV